jgi:hypothetical protein
MDEEDYYRLQRQSGREMEQDDWERASILYRPGDRVSSERGGEGEGKNSGGALCVWGLNYGCKNVREGKQLAAGQRRIFGF